MIQGTVTLTNPTGTSRQFAATSGSGHTFIIDDAADGSGSKPIELVAIAVAGCTAFDVINILRKKRQKVTSYEVHCEADQAPDPPEVTEGAVQEEIRLSEEKYCSVGAMVKHTAQLHTTFEIVSPVDAVAAV